MTDPKPYKVKIRWGDDGWPRLAGYEFATAAELEAFLWGVEESSGWADYTVVKPDEVEAG